ncbi:MAG: hypothetical protein BWY25_01791 [Chloroflexi bacterium ADurb.Bin222]|nr:MAG: hypothetical protein BWY25_01791 [Chloroflexi bacterium ADurb.Bin222]
MGYGGMLNLTASLYRVTQTEDEYGTPQPPTLSLVGKVPCAVTRQTITANQGAPMVVTGKSFRLYFMAGAPVKEGDVADVPGHGKFRLAAPYNVRGHHLEVDGTWEGEA